MNILGRFVTLRGIERSDLELLRTIINSPDVEKMIGGWAYPVSSEQQSKWFEANIAYSSDHVRFVIDAPGSGPIGLIGLRDIDWKNRSATVDYKLDERSVKSFGVAYDALMALLRYSFDELNLHRVYGHFLEYNEASKSLFKRCGGVYEGREREAIYKNGKYWDVEIISILECDYRTLLLREEYWD